jgi:hypothetical protein
MNAKKLKWQGTKVEIGKGEKSFTRIYKVGKKLFHIGLSFEEHKNFIKVLDDRK